jgi:hypothetical protein
LTIPHIQFKYDSRSIDAYWMGYATAKHIYFCGLLSGRLSIPLTIRYLQEFTQSFF